MADEQYTFAQARARLEEIVAQVRKKDTSLEKSLDLLEEGVRLANTCTELSDHTEWRTVIEERSAADESGAGGAADEAPLVETPVAETGGEAPLDAGPAEPVGEGADDVGVDGGSDGAPAADDESAPRE